MGVRDPEPRTVDLLVIGGGINGTGIARDAAGRGLDVLLCERDDLGAHTSSASTKLIHGGLRYLEQRDFRLVRHSLQEREVLLRNAPHIIWPLRFVLPHHAGLRPWWLIRLGLILYDHLGGRALLPPCKSVDLDRHVSGRALKKRYRRAFEYSDCWVQDSRLVVLNARDAHSRGAEVRTRTECVSLARRRSRWEATLVDRATGARFVVSARGVVNASGPWVGKTLDLDTGADASHGVRLVKGSHIVVRKMFDHPCPYIFQSGDGRVLFAIPFEEDYTLLGTTDVEIEGHPRPVAITSEEVDYICAVANAYFEKPLSTGDVVWSYSGIRPLFDDQARNASEVTRDYVLQLDRGAMSTAVRPSHRQTPGSGGTMPRGRRFDTSIRRYASLAEGPNRCASGGHASDSVPREPVHSSVRFSARPGRHSSGSDHGDSRCPTLAASQATTRSSSISPTSHIVSLSGSRCAGPGSLTSRPGAATKPLPASPRLTSW